MAQTTMLLSPVVAVRGMPYDTETLDGCVSAIANGAIPFGALVEINSSGLAQVPQQTTLTKPFGVALYSAAADAGGYVDGDVVPVCRKGRVWAGTSGTAPSTLGAVNVRHASTDGNSEAQYRGDFTATATSVTVGQEKSLLPGVVCFKASGVSGLALIELNLPAGVTGATGATGPTGPTGP